MHVSKSNFNNILTDAQLITKFQTTHDNEVFGELYNRYYQNVKMYCLTALRHEQGAQDAAQDVLIIAFKKLDSLKNPDVWVAWLFRIARNLVLNRHKQNKRNRVVPVALGNKIADEVPDLEHLKEEANKLDALPLLLDASPSSHILTMKYVDGRSIQELSVALHIKESTVKMRLLRARKDIVKMYYQQVAAVSS